jgi:competence CoiA-like predicted nuclease
MLVAINELNERIFGDDADRTQKFRCPYCNEPVIWIDATFKIKHFRHKVESNCEPEPETKRHIEMKLFMMEQLGWSKDNLEIPLGFARPDLFKEDVAIEVQHSPISYESFLERTNNYSKNNIYVLWIFDNCLLKENVSESLKKAHEIYFGRIYIYRNNIEGSTKWSDRIMPVHFEGKKRTVKTGGYYNDGEYIEESYFEAYYKKKRTFNFGEGINLFDLITSVNTWKGNNFKIAMFQDKRFWKKRGDYGES